MKDGFPFMDYSGLFLTLFISMLFLPSLQGRLMYLYSSLQARILKKKKKKSFLGSGLPQKIKLYIGYLCVIILLMALPGDKAHDNS